MAKRQFHWSSVSDCVMHETDGDGNTLVTYTHEPGPNGPLISEHRNGQEYVHHYDAQGSTTMLTDESGEVTDKFTYDAWGNEVARTGTTDTPYRWNGRWGYQWDNQTHSYYVRRRIFEPAIGKWTSYDPLCVHENINLYLYVLNTPGMHIDPSGMQCASAPSVNPVIDGDGICNLFSSHPTKWTFIKGLVTDSNGTTVGPGGTTVSIVSEITCYFEREISACYKCNTCCFVIPPADRIARRDAKKQAGFGTDAVDYGEPLFATTISGNFTPDWWTAIVNVFDLVGIDLPDINIAILVLTPAQQTAVNKACKKRMLPSGELQFDFEEGPSPHPNSYECNSP